jgi:hypothetical protein
MPEPIGTRRCYVAVAQEVSADIISRRIWIRVNAGSCCTKDGVVSTVDSITLMFFLLFVYLAQTHGG